MLVDALDPTKKQKLAAQKRAKQILSILGISKEIQLTEYEMLIASQLIDPATITVGFEAKITFKWGFPRCNLLMLLKKGPKQKNKNLSTIFTKKIRLK